MSMSMPGRRVAGPFWAQAVNQKKTTFTNTDGIYKSLYLRPCRSCRKTPEVPTMLLRAARSPANVPEKYVNIPSGKYIYVHQYVYICVYTYLCKMDEYRSNAGLSSKWMSTGIMLACHKNG